MGWTRDSNMPTKYISRTEEEQLQEVGAKLGFEEELPSPGLIEDLEPEDLMSPVSFVEIPTSTVGDAKAIADRLEQALKNLGTYQEDIAELKQKIARLEMQNSGSQG